MIDGSQWVRSALVALAVLVPSAASAQTRFFDSQGVRIRYVDQGAGEPVVLVHGFMGRLEGWSQGGITEQLLPNYRVIALDARGHGESGKPHDPEAYGKEMALDVIRLLDHLGIERAHLVGYSMGARLVGWLLANRPERLITATLGASPPRLTGDTDDESRAAEFIAAMERRAREAPPDGGQDYAALAAIPRSWPDQEVSPSALKGTTVPTLAIVGSEDPRLPGGRALQSLIPGLILIVVEGADHGQTIGRAEFIQGLSSFLHSHPAGR